MNKILRMLVTGGAILLCVAAIFVLLVSVSSATGTTISVQSVDIDGMTPVYSTSVAAGFQFVNDGRVMIHAKNASANTVYMTVTTPYSENGLALADVYVTLAATTGESMVGPLPTKLFNNSSGYVQVDFSATTSVTAAAIKLP